jgi:DNA-binding response OmpR family regulator
VLVVDDAPATQFIVAEYLVAHGFVPTVLGDGRSALEAFARAPGAFDIALLDHALPAMSGLDLAAAIATLRPGFPVVMLTGRPPEAFELAAARVARCIVKPVALSLLAATLRDVLGAH